MHPIEFIKKHPVGVGVGLFAVGALYIFTRGSSSADTGAQSLMPSSAEVQAATQLQAAQIQAQQQSQSAVLQAGVANNQISGQVQVAQIQAATDQNYTNVTTGGSVTIAGLQAQVADAVSTLQATVANNQIQSNVDLAQIAANEAVTIASLPYQHPAQSTPTASVSSVFTTLANETAAWGNQGVSSASLTTLLKQAATAAAAQGN